MSSAKKIRELNRAKTEHDNSKLSAQIAQSNHTMLNIAESILAKEIEVLRKKVAKLEAELERERMRLAACGVAALGYFDNCKDEYRSASLDDTLLLRENYTTEQHKVKELSAALDKVSAVRNIGSAHIISREALATVNGE